MKSMAFKKTFSILLLIISIMPICAYAKEQTLTQPKLIVFFSPTCHRCMQVRQEVMPDIEKEFKGKIQIEYRDIADINNYTLMVSLKEKYKSGVELEIPVFFFEGKFLDAKGEVRNNLKALLSRPKNLQQAEEKVSAVDLVGRFKSFKLVALVAAGLEDGINPCAFTVIVFFISFLALQGYRKKELAAIGLSFIFAVFLTYLLIGIGIFNFLYSLKGFWALTKAINISVGILSIILGCLALYDFFKFKLTGKTEGLVLQLPKSVKYQINKVIGLHYRLAKDTKGQAIKPGIAKLITSAFITGFLVSLLEAVCTGQLYLPTISFVLKTTNLKLHALGYLLLYNILFCLPLFVIFLLALLGTTSEEFSRFLRSRLGAIKVFMAVLFFGLGIFLIWRG